MRIGTAFTLSVFCLGITACGGSAGGGSGGGGGGGGSDFGGTGPVIPVDHTLALSKAVTFSDFYGFEFQLPTAASVHFSANETTTDTWNVAVWTPAEWVSYQNGSGNQAYGGAHNNVMGLSDTSVDLPAGDWFLGFKCTNAFERCMLVFNLDATY